jgi:hypothetical protein
MQLVFKLNMEGEHYRPELVYKVSVTSSMKQTPFVSFSSVSVSAPPSVVCVGHFISVK